MKTSICVTIAMILWGVFQIISSSYIGGVTDATNKREVYDPGLLILTVPLSIVWLVKCIGAFIFLKSVGYSLTSLQITIAICIIAVASVVAFLVNWRQGMAKLQVAGTSLTASYSIVSSLLTVIIVAYLLSFNNYDK